MSELRRLNELSAQVRGSTPLDDPRRSAGFEFCALAAQAIEEFGISSGQLSLALGLSYDNIRLKLSRRGYGVSLSSQPSYKGKIAVPYRKSEPRAFCRKGHPYAGDNLMIIRRTGARRCRECDNAARRAWYAANKAAARG